MVRVALLLGHSRSTLGWGPHTLHTRIYSVAKQRTLSIRSRIICIHSQATVTDAATYLLVLPNLIFQVEVTLKNQAQNYWRRQALGTFALRPLLLNLILPTVLS
jgi:hypothetical protein